ncbi:MAG TPA: addiction module protein [Thermoanaerobaculia bacterium]
MTRHELETEILRLEPRERAQLTHLLVTSLDELTPEQVQEIWLDEAERRDHELETGDVHAVRGPEVFARLRRDRG